MGTKVKGILKGFRYITHMFDEKETELQIGLPTDVKHVSHIGWEGSSANTPSWMNGFQSAPDLSSQPLTLTSEAKSPFTKTSDVDNNGNEKPKHRRRRSTSKGGESPATLNSPSRRGSDTTRNNSRRQETSNTTSSSPLSSPRPPRRNQCSNMDSPLRDSESTSPGIPKHGRRKKSKESSRSSRLKGQSSSVETSTTTNGD